MDGLVFAVGGGGDVISAAVISRKIGYSPGLLPWERYVVDPLPGPLRLEDLRGGRRHGPYIAAVDADAVAVRGGRTIRPQASCVAAELGEVVYAASPSARPSELGAALAESFRGILGLDVGGDVMARGDERELRSPLADSFSLASLVRASEAGAEVEVGVVALGADGELPRDYLLRVAAGLAKGGHFRGYMAIGPEDVGLLGRLVGRCVTEASAMPLAALRGECGRVPIREGTRTAELDLYTPIVLRFEPRGLLEVNRIAGYIYENDLDVFSAAAALRGMGCTTEYDVEELIAAGASPGDAARIASERRNCRI